MVRRKQLQNEQIVVISLVVVIAIILFSTVGHITGMFAREIEPQSFKLYTEPSISSAEPERFEVMANSGNPNLLLNPSMEEGIVFTGYGDIYNWSDGTTENSIDWSNAQAYDGVNSVEFENPTTTYSARALQQNVSVTVGSNYSISGWFYVAKEGTAVIDDTDFRIYVNWLDNADAILGTSGFTTQQHLAAFATWGNINKSNLTAPALAVTAQVIIECKEDHNNNSHAFVDLVSFGEVGTPAPNWSDNKSFLVSPYDGGESSFNISWNDSGVVELSFSDSVDTAFFESNYSGSPQNYSMNNVGLDVYNYSAIIPAGSYYWRSHANDTYGNWNTSDTWYFSINPPLAVILISPSAGAASGQILTNATITDGAGVNASRVFYWLSNSSGNQTAWTNLTNNTATHFNATFNTFLLADGAYNITINASDNSGNINATEYVQITIDNSDNTAPTVTLLSPANLATETTSTVSFSYNVIDTNNISNCSLIIDNNIEQTDTSITTSTTQTFTQVGLFDDMTYSWYINCTDQYGNRATTSSQTLYVDTTPTAVVHEGGSSSAISKISSSGVTTIAETSQILGTVSRNTPVVINIKDPAISISNVEITTKEAAKNVMLTVRSLSDKPKTVEALQGKVYQYLSISTNNLRSDNIQTGKIAFEVPVSWFAQNNINKDSILLNRYVNNQWTSLVTKILTQDKESLTFEAETPGFSYFAITGEAEIAVAPEPTPEPESIVQQTIRKKSFFTPLTIGLILIILAAIGFFIYQQVKSKQPQAPPKQQFKKPKQKNK